jgi:hypothetical protein
VALVDQDAYQVASVDQVAYQVASVDQVAYQVASVDQVAFLVALVDLVAFPVASVGLGNSVASAWQWQLVARNLVEVVAVASHLLSQLVHWLLQQVQELPEAQQVQQVLQEPQAQQMCCWLPVLRLQA